MGWTRDLKTLEHRRLQAIDLLGRGLAASEVASRLAVSYQAVSRWRKLAVRGGAEALRAAPSAGRRPRLSEDQGRNLLGMLLAGPRAQGVASDVWTLEQVSQLVAHHTGIRYGASGVWYVLKRIGCPPLRQIGLSVRCA